MFQHLDKTSVPPDNKPLMVYDGKCDFCRYWIVKWKMMTGNNIEYTTFQKAAKQFPDIEIQHFKEAVRLILPDGTIYSGPAAAYYTYFIRNSVPFLFKWYQSITWFRRLNDYLYQWIADNRNQVFKFCIKMLGKNPRKQNYNWLKYLTGFALILLMIIYFY
ncbi:MAG: DUF393 domain-containing protein [Flavobacteriales bacterium]|nr:DUF393 domain-containing protein [Flavobacteriales bacterium]